MGGDNLRNRDIDRIWLSTADEIAAAIGRSARSIPRLVKTDGLPAFKFYGKWTALPEQVKSWSRQVAERKLDKRPATGANVEAQRYIKRLKKMGRV
jgi:hypothetical protein